MFSRIGLLTLALALLLVLAPSHSAKADILSDIGSVLTDVTDFFTVTMPEFITVKLPAFLATLEQDLPVLAENITGFFSDVIPRLLQLSSDLATFFADLLPQMATLSEDLLNFFSDVIPRLAEFGSQLVGFFGELLPKLAEFGVEIASFFGSILSNIDTFASNIASFFETLSEGISGFSENIFTYFETFTETVDDLTTQMDDQFETAFETIGSFEEDFLVDQFESMTEAQDEFFGGGFQETFEGLSESGISSPLETVFGDIEEGFSSLELLDSLTEISGVFNDLTTSLSSGDLTSISTEFPQFTQSIQSNLDALDELTTTVSQFVESPDGTNILSLEEPIEDALKAVERLVEILPALAEVFANVEGDDGATEDLLVQAIEETPEILAELPELFRFFNTEFPVVLAEAQKQLVVNLPGIINGLPALIDGKIQGILTTLQNDITKLLSFVPGTETILKLAAIGDTTVGDHYSGSKTHIEQSSQLALAVQGLMEQLSMQQEVSEQVSMALQERAQLEQQIVGLRAEIQSLNQTGSKVQLRSAQADNEAIQAELELIMQLMGLSNGSESREEISNDSTSNLSIEGRAN